MSLGLYRYKLVMCYVFNGPTMALLSLSLKYNETSEGLLVINMNNCVTVYLK